MHFRCTDQGGRPVCRKRHRDAEAAGFRADGIGHERRRRSGGIPPRGGGRDMKDVRSPQVAGESCRPVGRQGDT